MTLPSIRVKSLTWLPHIAPVATEDATPEQLEAMEITPSSTEVSPYVRTLAHDPESYVTRTKLFNAIMYVPDGLPRQDRELGALGASIENGCIYCAVVHAQRHSQLAMSTQTVSALVLGRTEAIAPRDQAILDFARALSQTPPAASRDHVDRLREFGLTDDQILDLVHAIAIFGWANRLMHVLGHSEPAHPIARAGQAG